MSGVGETTQQHDHDHDHDHEHAGVEGRVGELIAWLGKFHPLVVHFPIALIVAAAVAEVLLIVTGRSLFDDAGRFCVWLGSLSAVEAGVLGWFLGGFHLVDSEWVMTTHRWLGSLVVLMAVIVLVLRERSRQGGGSGRVWFRVALFMSTVVIAATGFFGGALIYGLDHLAW